MSTNMCVALYIKIREFREIIDCKILNYNRQIDYVL